MECHKLDHFIKGQVFVLLFLSLPQMLLFVFYFALSKCRIKFGPFKLKKPRNITVDKTWMIRNINNNDLKLLGWKPLYQSIMQQLNVCYINCKIKHIILTAKLSSDNIYVLFHYHVCTCLWFWFPFLRRTGWIYYAVT